MMALALFFPLVAAGIYRYMQIHRPYGGFCTFEDIGRRAALTQATSIGVFIVKE